MGMKRQPTPPPAVETQMRDGKSVIDRTAEKEAKLETERKKMVSAKAQGQYGTVLTTGMGVTDEKETAKTALGGVL